MSLVVAAGCLSLFAGPLTAQETANAAKTELHERIEATLEEAAADPRFREGFALAALVEVDGAVVWRGAKGNADLEGKVAATEHTLFNVASVTKSFTALAVMQLEQAAKLRLTDELGAYFDELPDDKRGITLAQLLTHRSGIPLRYASEGLSERDEAVEAIVTGELESKPGERFSYANENYDLLAAVVERVSGQPFEAYLREHVLDPAGMRATRFWTEVKEGEPPAAAKITPVAAAGTAPARDWGFVGSGGLYTTVGDLYAWFGALRGDALLSRESRERMWKPEVDLGGGRSVASGWFVSTTRGTREVWTRGNESFGHNAVLRWFPERRVLVIVLTGSGEADDKNTTANRTVGDALVELLI